MPPTPAAAAPPVVTAPPVGSLLVPAVAAPPLPLVAAPALPAVVAPLPPPSASGVPCESPHADATSTHAATASQSLIAIERLLLLRSEASESRLARRSAHNS